MLLLYFAEKLLQQCLQQTCFSKEESEAPCEMSKQVTYFFNIYNIEHMFTLKRMPFKTLIRINCEMQPTVHLFKKYVIIVKLNKKMEGFCETHTKTFYFYYYFILISGKTHWLL